MSKKIVVIDNFDSFTFNIIDLLKQVGIFNISVFRNNKIDLKEINNSSHIILSPGPGIPSEAGQMPNIIKEFYQKKSILGVCLGHQAIGEFFGFSLKQLDIPFHGLSTENIVLDVHSKLFLGLPNNFKVGRYHSWVIEGAVEEINISSVDENKNIMSIAHKQYPIFGVQFHPESILSEHGQKIILNFLNN